MTRSGSWGHGLRILAILVLLGAAAFPLYWMFVTSMTPSSELFAPRCAAGPEAVRNRRISRCIPWHVGDDLGSK